MGLFGSKKEERENEEIAIAVEVLHIAFLQTGDINEDIMEQAERKLYGISLKDLLANGRTPRAIITDKEGTKWNVFGKIP
jgi:hypothetical protein